MVSNKSELLLVINAIIEEYVMLKMNNDDDPFNTVLVSTAEKGFGFLLQINGGWEQIRFGLK